MFMTKNRLYICGGNNDSSSVNTVYSATVYSDGRIGGWVSGSALPGATAYAQPVVTKNRVYLLGGYNGSALSVVYTAQIDANGFVGSWTTGTALPVTSHVSQTLVVNNKVYLLAGQVNGSYSGTVYTASINADGTLGAWTAGTSLPIPIGTGQAIITKDRVYYIGGQNVSNRLSNVYTASIIGGMNDYSPYYDGSITAPEQFITVAKFKLPDSSYMNDGLSYFIKY